MKKNEKKGKNQKIKIKANRKKKIKKKQILK